ncbi:alpha/beta fold hydrolase [Kitasatospora acidiphila]|uniref:Alpha/beta fold hydrolase n=1 Tax=Kitasatospora acidiphila TaxID=2567942 RepID=A0A540W128_9ACTN|nr:alpha/beta fold hydrolase [Kitasatospora acidiphila]TQF02702.1 alpha/beta fold hydrolase [Kitasatospora acidiphila]
MKQTPVVLIHGAWFHLSSWDGWAERLSSHGYAVCVPGWPGEAPTADQARREPGPLRDLGLVALTAHYEEIVRSFDNPPVLIGHSAGGLIAQRLLGNGLGVAAVALAPLPVGGLPLDDGRPRPWSLMPVGSTRHPCFESLSRSRFRHVIANAVGEEEAAKLFDRYAVPAPLRLLADLGLDRTAAGSADTVVDTANAVRGPLLLVSGQEDRTVPDAVTRSVYKLYGDSSAMTDLKQFVDRGHSMVFDSGWRSVADHVLAWLAGNGVEAVPAQA